MRIAIIHDWLITPGGSEKVLKELLYLLRNHDTTLFTLMDFLSDEDRLNFLFGKKTQTSFLQTIPGIHRNYKYYLPLFPKAIRSLNTSDFDLIISSSHSVAKGVRKYPGQMHISYCHTPMRYIWDLRKQYMIDHGVNSGLKRLLVKPMVKKLRKWDYETAANVDFFIANSKHISKRIKQHYEKESTVIYPPVNTSFFSSYEKKEDFFVTASRLVPYKKVGLIAEAFAALPDKRLIIIGNGSCWQQIRKNLSSNIEMIQYDTSEVLRYYLQRARAFIFAAEEDFGITPVEAMACGTPVIGYNKGGLLETVKDGISGQFFQHQTVKSIVDAIYRFENDAEIFQPQKISQTVAPFSQLRFRKEISDYLFSHAGLTCSM
ncbi:MAG: glycosyltransferase [Candidatus Competibacteraceae bacterium]|nr:glycosyltransferase [Candidatus Competibacteraceae bacterium]